jgi:hypothetical protein
MIRLILSFGLFLSLILTFGLLINSAWADAEYSSLGVKCISTDSDKTVTLYLGVSGKIYQRNANTVKLKIFSKKWDSGPLSKGITFKSNIFGGDNFSWFYQDPFNYQWNFYIASKAFTQNGATVEGTLTRAHHHPDVNVNQTFKLSCTIKVKTTETAPIILSLAEFKKYTDDERSALLGSAADRSEWSLELLGRRDENYDRNKLDKLIRTAEKQLQVFYDWQYRQGEKEFPEALKPLAKKLEEMADKMVEERNKDENIKDEDARYWSSEYLIVTNKKNEILGIIIILNNANGTDDYDDDSWVALFLDENNKQFYDAEGNN